MAWRVRLSKEELTKDSLHFFGSYLCDEVAILYSRMKRANLCGNDLEFVNGLCSCIILFPLISLDLIMSWFLLSMFASLVLAYGVDERD